MSIKSVFFGTPEPAVEILKHLKRHNLVPSLIVTNPDRPQGRNMRLTPPPVKVWAVQNKIPVLQPENPSGPEFLRQLSNVNCQLFIVVAYGVILPKDILALPKHGALNIHYSLLPKFRGATPIESQILNDDRDTGVTLMLMDEKLDHGPIVAQQKVEIRDWPPKASELRSVCNRAAEKLLVETLPKWVAGKIEAVPQDHTKATYTKKLTKADGEIDLNGDAYKNFLKIQAFQGSIGTYFYVDTEQTRNKSTKRDGTISRRFRVGGVPLRSRVLIKSAEFRDGKLHLLRVIPEGKKEMSYEDFLRGFSNSRK